MGTLSCWLYLSLLPSFLSLLFLLGSRSVKVLVSLRRRSFQVGCPPVGCWLSACGVPSQSGWARLVGCRACGLGSSVNLIFVGCSRLSACYLSFSTILCHLIACLLPAVSRFFCFLCYFFNLPRRIVSKFSLRPIDEPETSTARIRIKSSTDRRTRNLDGAYQNQVFGRKLAKSIFGTRGSQF